jgi:cytochrome c553
MPNARRIFVGGLTVTLLALAGGVAAAGPLDAPGAAKALVCSACHGVAGNSRSDTMPIIAGLWPEYFKKSIQDYASGKRPSPEMEPYAKQVLDLGVDDLAAFFAGQRREPTAARLDPAAVERGRVAAAECAVCHGKDGKGDRAKLIPDITGQPPGFLRNQMLLFKADRRSPGDPNIKALKELMKSIPDERLADLAAFFASQR